MMMFQKEIQILFFPNPQIHILAFKQPKHQSACLTKFCISFPMIQKEPCKMTLDSCEKGLSAERAL
jgi:hypothetical protein